MQNGRDYSNEGPAFIQHAEGGDGALDDEDLSDLEDPKGEVGWLEEEIVEEDIVEEYKASGGQ